jgi:hypothetical protein
MVLNRTKAMLQQRMQRTVERKNEVLCRESGTLLNVSVGNKPIHQILKAIDNHTRLHLETGDFWHEEQAQILRKYLRDLKDFIHKEEAGNYND